MAYPCDLHCHSVRSDGNDTYEELADVARARGVRLFAVTDHDQVPQKEVAGQKLTDYARARGVYIVPGIEFSCDTQVEDVHIVGLGCDFDAPVFGALAARMAASKRESYRKLVQMLAEDGMDICWQDVIHTPQGDVPEEGVQRKHIFEAMARKQLAPDWSQAKVMVQTTPRYAGLKREKVSPREAIEAIRSTGGMAILAHPHLIDAEPHPGVTRAAYIEQLISCGLQGIEAAYPYGKTSYKGQDTEAAIERAVRAAYAARLFISGGSDYHDDGKKGVENPRMMGEKGVTLEDIRACETLRRIVLRLYPAAKEFI